MPWFVTIRACFWGMLLIFSGEVGFRLTAFLCRSGVGEQRAAPVHMELICTVATSLFPPLPLATFSPRPRKSQCVGASFIDSETAVLVVLTQRMNAGSGGGVSTEMFNGGAICHSATKL